jgi:hypothetical protein
MKRKINIKTVLMALVLWVSLGSCSKDFIERTPSDSLTPAVALANENLLQIALNGAYASLRAVGLYGRTIPVIGDLHADNTYVEKKNSGRYLLWYNYTVSATDGDASDMWTNAYTGIMRANRVIDANLTGGNVDAIKAEAMGIRGLLYFKLVNIFAKQFSSDPASLGVPIVLHFVPYGLPARNTVTEVYTQIIADLKAAYAKAGPYKNSATLSKYSIGALLAKAYLYSGDNTNALATAKDVINNGGFTLAPASGLSAYWHNPATTTNKVETLFEVDADVLNNNGFNDLAGIYENGYNDIYASGDLYKLYSATDARKGLMIEGKTKSGSAAIIVNKFANAQNNDRDNIKVIRLAEVYLIAAEAAFRTSDEPGALGFLNALMIKRDPAFIYASAGAQLLTDIITERRKELAFEGDRLFDLNRLKLPIIHGVNAGAIPVVPDYVTVSYPNDKRIAPIPQVELLSNPSIAGQQNPSY